MLSGFGPILLFLIVSAGLSIGVVCIPFFVSRFITNTYKPSSEKNSAYECGFNPFDDARNEFEVRFYLVASVTNQLNN